jgi:hypothetical protein
MSNPRERILQTIQCSDREVRFAVRCGSRVYGTHGAHSDEDFFVVLADRKAKQDLAWGDRINVIVHGADAFERAILEQSVFALECLFAPPDHRLKESSPPFVMKADKRRLFGSAKSRSDSDYAKARKGYEDEPHTSLKKVFHSLRVLSFAKQVAEHDRISDYSAANHWWPELSNKHVLSWDEVEDRFGSIRNRLVAELETLSQTTSKSRR